MNLKEIWSFKHEPQNLDDAVYHPEIKKLLYKALEEIPNLVLYGPAGVGKGTFANILLKKHDLKPDGCMWINASRETGIDYIRNKVEPFCVTAGMTPIKVVVFNEADALTKGEQGAQKTLKQLMEDVQKRTRFIFLTNHFNKISDEIKSRCLTIKVIAAEKKDIAKHCLAILKKEGVEYDSKKILSIINKCYPDIRKTVNSLKENLTKDNKILTDFVHSDEVVFQDILTSMKEADVEKIRKILRSNPIDYDDLYTFLFDNAGQFSSPGDAIITIGEHSYRDNVVQIREINFMHMVMVFLKEAII